jgi:tRNA (guanine37-N1)-methyltransferase
MRIDIITIFPDMFREVFDFGIVRRAREAGLVAIQVHDLRDWAKDVHRTTDDAPYGGGPGMVMKVEPLVDAVESVSALAGAPAEGGVVLLSPRGTPLRQALVRELASFERLVLVAGRYEGVDERFVEATGAREISIGDYVLSGGEIPAMVMVDAVVRLVPGAISDPRSAEDDSFSRGLLDYPHYTRPAEFRGLAVPDVLLSGNHRAVQEWRHERALEDTRTRRPELLEGDVSIHAISN